MEFLILDFEGNAKDYVKPFDFIFKYMTRL